MRFPMPKNRPNRTQVALVSCLFAGPVHAQACNVFLGGLFQYHWTGYEQAHEDWPGIQTARTQGQVCSGRRVKRGMANEMTL